MKNDENKNKTTPPVELTDDEVERAAGGLSSGIEYDRIWVSWNQGDEYKDVLNTVKKYDDHIQAWGISYGVIETILTDKGKPVAIHEPGFTFVLIMTVGADIQIKGGLVE